MGSFFETLCWLFYAVYGMLKKQIVMEYVNVIKSIQIS